MFADLKERLQEMAAQHTPEKVAERLSAADMATANAVQAVRSNVQTILAQLPAGSTHEEVRNMVLAISGVQVKLTQFLETLSSRNYFAETCYRYFVVVLALEREKADNPDKKEGETSSNTLCAMLTDLCKAIQTRTVDRMAPRIIEETDEAIIKFWQEFFKNTYF